jgi:hypothetical protein
MRRPAYRGSQHQPSRELLLETTLCSRAYCPSLEACLVHTGRPADLTLDRLDRRSHRVVLLPSPSSRCSGPSSYARFICTFFLTARPDLELSGYDRAFPSVDTIVPYTLNIISAIQRRRNLCGRLSSPPLKPSRVLFVLGTKFHDRLYCESVTGYRLQPPCSGQPLSGKKNESKDDGNQSSKYRAVHLCYSRTDRNGSTERVGANFVGRDLYLQTFLSCVKRSAI